MRTILHIGSDKTGTTALQDALSRSRPALAERGISYPDLDGRPNHAALADGGGADRVLADLRRRRADGPPATIISSEAFWSLDADAARRLVDALGPGVQILGWVRGPGSYVEALYRQRLLEAGSERRLRALLHVPAVPAIANPICRRAVARYRAIPRWRAVAESTSASIRLLPYDRHADIVSAFAEATGLEAVRSAVPSTRERQNTRLDLISIYAAVLVAERTGDHPQRFVRYCRANGLTAPDPAAVPNAVVDAVRRRITPILAESPSTWRLDTVLREGAEPSRSIDVASVAQAAHELVEERSAGYFASRPGRA